MKVKFRTSVAGYDNGERFVFGGGEVINLPVSEALYWIREGLADKTDEEGEEELEAKRPLIPEVKDKKKTGKKVYKRPI